MPHPSGHVARTEGVEMSETVDIDSAERRVLEPDSRDERIAELEEQLAKATRRPSCGSSPSGCRPATVSSNL